MLPKRLQPGDTIGLASPSALATEEKFRPIIEALTNMGYRVKCADNLYAHGWGYAASDTERAADLNQLIRDSDVKMVFFSGGEGADDMLPLIDYDAAKENPKLWLSYSDGTSILNTIWARTGIVTCYGQMPGLVTHMSEYDAGHFARGVCAVPQSHVAAQAWHSLTSGVAHGTLMGGYLYNLLFLVATGRIPLDRKYVLFVEDHEQFNLIDRESSLIGQLEQCGLLAHVTGLLFGHYSDPVNPYLLQRLKLLGERWNIPVAYCDDFGHGVHHAVLPIGAQATLDTTACTLSYQWGRDEK